MFPKKGNVFPRRGGGDKSPVEYADIVAAALRSELGDTHRAVKIVMRWTGASERTVKNWLSGEFGPSGDHLIVLLRESDSVLEAILGAAGRRDMLHAMKIFEAHGRWSEVLAMVVRQQIDPLVSTTQDRSRELKIGGSRRPDGPLNGPVNDPVNRARDVDLNERQRWFLQELARGGNVGAVDLRRRWGISERTAKRDISELKAGRLIEFVGSFKTGAYRFTTG